MYIRGRTLLLSVISTVVLSSALTVSVLRWQRVDFAGADAQNGLLDPKSPEFAKLLETYQTLKGRYYTQVDDRKLIDGAIAGMIGALDDPFSTYMDKETAAQFQQSLSSSFEGIGAEIKSEDGKVTIVAPYKNSPAEKAGLRPGDQIRKVDGKVIDGMDLNQAVLLIRGKKGTKVTLEITRPGSNDVMDVTVVRDDIPLETVYADMLPGGIGKIQITTFAEKTADRFKEELSKLEAQGMKGLIIDLRNDPGGLLNSVVDIANQLIPDKKVILQVEYRDGKKDVYRSTLDKGKYPIVVLIDGGSASAAEILAAALKESGGYPLVGEKSFGKGTVQTTQAFDDGSNFKYTMAKWLTPNGNWIHKKGIQPDYPVALPAYAKLPPLNPDNALKKDMNDPQVKVLQQFLEGLGYSPGRDDGYFSEQTEEAVKTFQKMKGLAATGVVQGDTSRAINDAVRARIKENDPQLQKAIAVLQNLMK
jgi:carboxyl-terminal processing protease